jgi:hypothetical protein
VVDAGIIDSMSDKQEESTDSIPVADPAAPQPAVAAAPTYGPPPVYAPPPQPVVQKPSRLNQVAALVGIAAGVVVIVAVIFGTGFMLGAHSGRHHGGGGWGHDRGNAMEHRGGPQMFPMGPMMRQGPAFVFPGGPGFQGGGPNGPTFQGGPFENGQGGSGQGPGSGQPTQPGR